MDDTQLEQISSARGKVNFIQSLMNEMPLADMSNNYQGRIELEIKDYFAHNMYAREMYVPKGILLVGKIHKYEHISIISKGDISILIDDKITRVQAPFTFVAPPGTKRIAYSHEDTIWTVMHSTIEKDVDQIENYFIAQDEKEYLEFLQNEKLLERS